MKIAFATFVLLASLTQAVVLADGNTGIVRGTVLRYDTGKPMSNITVYWINPSGMGSTQTDSRGRFYFFNVVPGQTTIASTATSFATGCLRGYVQANETVDAVIPMFQRVFFGCAPLHAAGRAAVQDRY